MNSQDDTKEYEKSDNEEEPYDEPDPEFIKQTEQYFEEIWKEVKEECKEFSKKDLARHMFVSGALMLKKNIDREMMGKSGDGVEDSLWEDGAFMESVSPEEMKQKERTIHMKHDEEMNYNCQKCNKVISAHNKDWHAGKCDKCFDEDNFPKK